jgi:hypothetical protein
MRAVKVETAIEIWIPQARSAFLPVSSGKNGRPEMVE